MLAVEMHYIYYLLDPTTQELLYVGRALKPKSRLKDHERRLGRCFLLSPFYQRFTDFDKACEAELTAIKKHRPPLNKRITSSRGHLGIPNNQKTRDAVSKNMKARWNEPAARQAVSQHFKALPRTEEHCRKISEALKGHPGAMLGRKHSDEARAKIAAAKRLYWENRRAST